MIAILSLLNVVMSSVIQFDKSIHPMVLSENDLISIFMNVYVKLQKKREILRGMQIQGMIVLTIHLAPNKCPYVYHLRHLFSGNLSLCIFRSFSIFNCQQDCLESYRTCRSIACALCHTDLIRL